MPIILTEGAFLLIQLLIQNAIAAAINQVSSMTPEEIDAAISIEQERNQILMSEVESH